jgi:Protein of unknown function (DUF3052)
MQTVKLISWDEDIDKKAAALKRRGLRVDAAPLIKTSSFIGELARLSPAVLVLDLDRLPSQSREIAIGLRSSKSARHIPILFVGGLPEKIKHVRAALPDASFTCWSKGPQALAELLRHPPSTPAFIPARDFSTTPLVKKLGIAKDMHIALIAAPDTFEELLGELPDSVSFTTRIGPKSTLALCFVRSLEDLAATLDLLTLRLPKQASVWIVHPKRTGRHHVDFNQTHVRDHALTAGLVDYKVCSVDNDWSALKFAWRKR